MSKQIMQCIKKVLQIQISLSHHIHVFQLHLFTLLLLLLFISDLSKNRCKSAPMTRSYIYIKWLSSTPAAKEERILNMKNKIKITVSMMREAHRIGDRSTILKQQCPHFLRETFKKRAGVWLKSKCGAPGHNMGSARSH